MTAPPLAPLLEAAGTLERAGIPCALGGSGLLAALGLADEVHDWDLTCEASIEELERVFAHRPYRRFDGSGVHADHKLTLADAPVEVIARFAFHVGDRVVRIPLVAGGDWNGVPLASPEAWAVAYTLLGRPAKAEALFAHLARVGVDPGTRARLLAEPLPGPLAARLAALPGRAA